MKNRVLASLLCSGVFMLVPLSGQTVNTPGAGAGTIEAASADPVVMTINGEGVVTAEYKLVMEGRIAEVTGYFHGRGMDDHLGYWKDDGEAENPINMLSKVTKEELIRIKTIQGWAKKKGLMSDTSYAAFKQAFVSENARRQKALDNKEVIYGPKQYKEYRYYFFRLADLKQALLESLAKTPEYTIPEAEIVSFYNDNKKDIGERTLDDTRPRIVSMLQKRKFEAQLEERISGAKVEVDAAVLRGIAPRNDP